MDWGEVIASLLGDGVKIAIFTFLFNFFLEMYRERKQGPVKRVQIMQTLEDIADGLAKQLREEQEEHKEDNRKARVVEKELRNGIHTQFWQMEAAGLIPEWKPNGSKTIDDEDKK